VIGWGAITVKRVQRRSFLLALDRILLKICKGAGCAGGAVNHHPNANDNAV